MKLSNKSTFFKGTRTKNLTNTASRQLHVAASFTSLAHILQRPTKRLVADMR